MSRVLQTPTTSRPPAPSSSRGWFAVVSVTLGLFAIVTTEILPIGLLVEIREGFTVSDGTAGLTMMLPGVLAAIAAPVFTTATATMDRRVLLCGLAGVLAVANLLAAAAPWLWVLLLSRVLVGVVIGGFWSLGAGLAPRLVAPRWMSLATAVIFAAVPLSSVLGVPAGTFIGSLFGWRWAFGVMAVLSAVALVALAASLPILPPGRPTRARVLRELLRRSRIRTGLLVTAIVVVAQFGTYTYVAPLLDGSGVDATTIGVLLLAYGAAGVAGNFLAGLSLSRAPRLTFGVAAAGIAAATVLLPVAGGATVAATGLLVLWGLAYGAVPAASQTWFASAAPDAPEAATVVFTASFQAALSGGALLGGLAVDATSAAAMMPLGAGLAAGAVVMIAAVAARRTG